MNLGGNKRGKDGTVAAKQWPAERKYQAVRSVQSEWVIHPKYVLKQKIGIKDGLCAWSREWPNGKKLAREDMMLSNPRESQKDKEAEIVGWPKKQEKNKRGRENEDEKRNEWEENESNSRKNEEETKKSEK